MPIQAEGVPRKIADPFDFGGGHINPERTLDPGLVYDINPKEYTKFFNCTLELDQDCTTGIGKLYFLNLPSIAVPDLWDSVTVWRTVTNVVPDDDLPCKDGGSSRCDHVCGAFSNHLQEGRPPECNVQGDLQSEAEGTGSLHFRKFDMARRP
jgi:hypothetical protein